MGVPFPPGLRYQLAIRWPIVLRLKRGCRMIQGVFVERDADTQSNLRGTDLSLHQCQPLCQPQSICEICSEYIFIYHLTVLVKSKKQLERHL